MNQSGEQRNTKLIRSTMEVIEGNDYLLTQILVRLPLRDVKTFKRVSKRWRSLISAPYFRHCHTTVKRRISCLFLNPPVNSPHQELNFFYLDQKTASFFPKILDLPRSRISQSCNGLMLVQSRSDTFIYNPTTGHKKPLPSPFPSFDESRFRYYYSLAFDPLRFLGYKLICIYHREYSKEDSYRTMIYSSESGAFWKHCGSSFSAPINMHFARGVYFKDSVYWIDTESKTTLRFDLNEELVKDDMPPLPQQHHQHDAAGYGYRWVLAPACGYMNSVGFDSKYRISIFRLKEDDYSSRWVLMHSVDLRRCINLRTIYQIIILKNYFNLGYACSILHLIEDGEDEMTLLLQIPNKVIALRLKDNTCDDVLDFTRVKGNFLRYCSPGFKGWYRAFGFIESLACV
ncbi:hypothetical protein HN51_039057 [Arachis hypogaea]|uniref:F-box domain-containing protein n=2 Tax=Arachis TaxID=3817 RepID=A0A444YHM3_ARAHY|nr:F-box protein At5g07610-like [Arachis hypogaea]RYR01408.1 hypothetical protein Ahy_B06g080273 [Arachis hypogaea]